VALEILKIVPLGLFTFKINIILALVAIEDSHLSQGGMKFATQISPLLNCFVYYGFMVIVAIIVNKQYCTIKVNMCLYEYSEYLGLNKM
jgi:hypothetical protein